MGRRLPCPQKFPNFGPEQLPNRPADSLPKTIDYSTLRPERMPQKVLVTGGAGFLGSHLCERLVSDGYYVVCMDNLLTGALTNLDSLFGHERFTFVNYDVTNFIHVPGQLDYILHFASPASPIDYLKYPIQTLKVGSLGTHKVLGLARAKGARVLLASTSEVYGDPQIHPQHEDYWGNVNPVGLRGVYDEAKRFMEAMAMGYHRYHNLSVRIARIFNTYGPRMRLEDGRALPTFIGQALRGEAITVFGDGSQTRSFCYVDDLVEGLVRLLHYDSEEETQPVNIGNPEEITIREFAEEIIALTHTSSQICYKPLPQDDPQVRQPDIARAQALLDWAPQVERRTGLARTLEYFQQQVHAV
jgi:dTDP-glucose 4,6-dehydratase